MIEKHTYYIKIKGLVQGVGFRPFIYQLAKEFKLDGYVENHNEGVIITINATEKKLTQFCDKIHKSAPKVSEIKTIDYKKIERSYYENFTIRKSSDTSSEITHTCPDICICKECLEDLTFQKHRINYPFINCTNCGPRFSIIKDLPYDRAKTTMNSFSMCDLCKAEYSDVNDRRFHAQPVACNNCGPQYSLIINNKKIKSYDDILNLTATLLLQGKIIAVKGIGGFHLMCDAFNENTVKLLRERKKREKKAFATLFPNVEVAKNYALISKEEEKLLTYWAKPIVLLAYRKSFNPLISNGLNTIGVILPYTAFHYQIFEKTENDTAFILTSANISDEPIIIKNSEAMSRLKHIADAFLVYNREIYNRVDDSVAMLVNNKARILRRSRGYVPYPIEFSNLYVDGIVATGAELSNCFAMGRGNEIFLSQHIGDLKNMGTYNFYLEAINRFKKLFRIKNNLIVTDLHPDYLSTKWGKDEAKKNNVSHIKVQHHHAHIASCMGEHNLDKKVIGLSFDGTGLGTDNTIWGGEFLVCDFIDFERIIHFEQFALPGGDRANKEPWRMAVSMLQKTFGIDFIRLKLPIFQNIGSQRIKSVSEVIEKNINSPLTSSLGRVFDAVSSICGICFFNNYQAQAAMLLESYVDYSQTSAYSFILKNNNISIQPMIRGIVEDLDNSLPLQNISTKFHNTIINASVEAVKHISIQRNINDVVLSGGVFQNRYLLNNLEKIFVKQGFRVYSHSKIPSNDGGIALGQMLIAAKKRSLNLI